MKTVESIVIAFPLPRKLTAESGAEMKKKVRSLAKVHGQTFFVTLVEDRNGQKISHLRRQF